MLSSDVENPPPKSDPNSLAVVVPASSPVDGSDLCRSEHREGAAASTASDPPRTTTNNSFSIREYVFRSRSKDIYTNWPFSRENLQLCLRHDVTKVLPPFQHLDTARCGSFEIPRFKNRSVVGKDCVANFKSKPSSSNPKVPCLQGLDRGTELIVDGVASNEQLISVLSSTTDDVPLVAIRVSQVTTDQVPADKVIPPTCLKSGSLAQVGKKCKLIVKVGTKPERSFGDNTVSNCTSFSENMASKICPVCKTFSSSSNTTLNAHIDQCLSLESEPQRLSIQQKIKPRKTRLMVDIYETALRCTIEELNRRNGLIWANSSSLPAPNADAAFEEERRRSMPLVRADIPSDAGAVYIDAKGTKLRILSKYNDDPPELRSAKDEQSKKSSLGKKGSGIFKKNTKKLHRQKHYKYLKLASKGKKLHSQKSRKPQLFAKQKNHGTQEGSEGSQGRSQLSSLAPLKPGLSGTLKLWSSSKRTGPKKKFVKEGENPQRCQLHLAPSLLVEDDENQTSLVVRTLRKHRTPNLLDTSENSDYSRSCDSEKERSWPDFCAIEPEEPICERSLAWSDVTPDSIEKWGYPPAKRKLPKEDHFREVDIANNKKNTGHGELQLRRHRKGIGIHTVTGGRARTIGNISERQLRPRPSATKALRFSTLRKRALSLSQSSENSSDISAGQMEFSFKKSKLCLIEDPASDRSVQEDTNFEFSSGESSEKETIGLCECAETSDLRGEVQCTKSTLNDVRDTEPSVDALEHCTWGLSKYYELPHLNLRAYDACDVVNEENADDGKGDEGYDAGQSSSFIEIDPIPIPGPPGSFLPSPGAMGSDDFQGNSSLTNRDVSESPISATSTVSNSTEATVGMDYSEELVSGGRPLIPEDTWVAFSSAGNDTSPIQHTSSATALNSCSALVETIGRANDVSIKKGPPFTRDGNEPCCCQKKERTVSQISILDSCEMEPPSLRRVPPVAMPGATRQTVQIPSGGGRLDEGYERLIPKVAKSNISPSSKSFGEFPNGSGRADCDFPSPSGSNPVLRLMGKDLIVVNKDDDAGVLDRSQSDTLNTFKSQDSQPIAIRCISRESSQNQDYLIKDMDYSPPHSFFTGSSSSYSGIITMPVTLRAPKPVPVNTFINPEIAMDFTESMMGPQYDGRLNSSIQFDATNVKPVGPSKQMMHEVAQLMNPGKTMMVTGDESGKEFGYTSFAVNNMNFPGDAVMLPNTLRGTSALPAVYQTREPVAELTGSYPRGAVFINGKSRGPFVAAPPAFLGYQGSGYVYYQS